MHPADHVSLWIPSRRKLRWRKRGDLVWRIRRCRSISRETLRDFENGKYGVDLLFAIAFLSSSVFYPFRIADRKKTIFRASYRPL